MARAGTFEEWLAKVEDEAAEKAERERDAAQQAADAAERKRQANAGSFDVWVRGKEHRAKAVDVSRISEAPVS